MALNQGILILQKLDRMPQLVRPDFDVERHIYTLDGRILPSVTTITGILYDASHYTEEARHRGSMVHLACQLFDEGDLDPESVDPAIAPYLEAYQDYRQNIGIAPEVIEWPLANRALGYCGMPDRIIFSSAIEDIKSGAFEPWHRIQTAAYAYLLPEPMSVERRAVYLSADGSYSTRTFPKAELWADFNVFQSALNIHNWRARNK